MRPQVWLNLPLLAIALAMTSCSVLPLTDQEREAFWNLEAGFPDIPEGAVCHLHGVEMEPRQVPIEVGLCMEANKGYARAKLHRFPHSFFSVSNCGCELIGPEVVTRRVCPQCRAAEEEWRRSHPERFR